MIKIVSVLSLIASVCAGGYEPLLASYGAPLYSSRVVAPSLLSGVVGHSVVSVPAVAEKHITVARPSAVAVERYSLGSIPSVSVVNEPTTIVTPGKPIRGHSFTSEVRHDTRAAPLLTYAAPAIAAPLLASEPLLSKSEYALPVGIPSTVVSAPEVYASGPAAIVAGPAAVKGYTRETGRTELVNEVRLRAAHIPTTIYQDKYVESAPAVAPLYSPLISQPLVGTKTLGAPLLSQLIYKK